MPPSVAVILLAAGSGKRLGFKIPKAFARLAGRPLYEHSLRVFRALSEVRQTVVVVPRNAPLGPPRGVDWVIGGARRQDSVQAGLGVVRPECSIVLIHDAARPFVKPDLVRRVIAGVRRQGGAVAALPSPDTLKRVGKGGRILETPERSTLWAAQTPQGFRREILLRAYERGLAIEDATDDSQVVERGGGRVVVVEGDPANFKITSRGDWERAEFFLRRKGPGRPERSGRH